MFSREVDDAISEGTGFINDMAESQLIGAIKNQNFAAISFWLRNRHKAYTNKLQVDTTLKARPPELTEKETELVADVIRQLDERRDLIINSKQNYETTDISIQPLFDKQNDQVGENKSGSTDKID
jgi:hypothetical protein